jgi:multidrug efflux pump subunit AcrB
VVAGDAIRRELAEGQPRVVAAWLGPTKLATAILFATITNIVAYLPMLLIKGDTGVFIYSLPVVLTCSLVASRIVSMTFVPMLGYYLLRPGKDAGLPLEQLRQRGFGRFYQRFGGFVLDHRKMALASSLLFLAAGGYFLVHLRQEFFPKDLSYLSYLDVWLPEDSTIGATNEAAARAEQTVARVAQEYGQQHPGPDGSARQVLDSLTTFVGGGAPRFWFSAAPELLQTNYAQVIIRVRDKRDTEALVSPLQHALSAEVPGARIDVRQLETAQPIGIPVQVRISGDDLATLRGLAERAKGILRAIPQADRTRDNWGPETFAVRLRVDPDRANLSGVSNQDIALSSAAAISGYPVTSLRQGKDEIPVATRLRAGERTRLVDIQNLYVYAMSGLRNVPLSQVSSVEYKMETQRIQRRNQFRTITVSCFPIQGVLPSEIMRQARPGLASLLASLPPGFKMEIGGEEEEQIKGFQQLSVVFIVSVVLIFLALAVQFRSAVKPFIVFAALPFGLVGAFASLSILRLPFGFMAFLGIASLIGVIVSHVIVLFDFIEEARRDGQPLRVALIDASMVRLRPVMVTVAATAIALLPLALHGGPLWEPLCYAQIGGLLLATMVTLLLVPVLYAILVLDLKIVSWVSQNEA